MQISTGILERDQVEAQLPFVIAFFQEHAESAQYCLAVGSNIPTSEQWTLHPIEIDSIAKNTNQLVGEKKFVFGDSDLYLYHPNKEFHFLFCHESDIHFASERQDLLSMVRADWQNKGFNVHEYKN